MKLGLALSGTRDAADAVRVARVAEELGFGELWITEDYCERGAFAVAGAVAATTTRATVGIGVVNPWTRHSMVTAMEAAALAELAPGRVVVGLGASNPAWMTDRLGIPWEQPLDVLRGCTAVVRRALSGQDVAAHDGRYEVDARLAATPPGPVPIVLGVKGARALALAAEVADGALLSVLSSPAYVRWARQRTGSLPLGAYVAVSCDDDHEAARDRLRPFVAAYLGLHGHHAITRVAGLAPEVAHALRRGWLDGTPRVDLVDDHVLDVFAVAGDPAHCRRLVARLADAGVDTLVVHDHGGSDPATQLQAIRELVPG